MMCQVHFSHCGQKVHISLLMSNELQGNFILKILDWWRRAGIHFNAFWAGWKMSLTSSMASLFPVRWGATHTATALYNWDTICITALFNACIDSLLGCGMTLL